MLALARGDVQACMGALRQVSAGEAAQKQDGLLRNMCLVWTDATLAMHAAERLDQRELDGARAELEAVRDAIKAIAGPDAPPWYPIQFLILCARLLTTTPGTLDQAADSAAQALDRARVEYPDLIPECGRLLGEQAR
ncbi:hypothetical protein [Sorangium sp. So ce887]|uniref:hypothetical protein n=1 Tax=Sorangium sp. So ce887 TaxID=3133324 RepID=UPI003F5F1B7B